MTSGVLEYSVNLISGKQVNLFQPKAKRLSDLQHRRQYNSADSADARCAVRVGQQRSTVGPSLTCSEQHRQPLQ